MAYTSSKRSSNLKNFIFKREIKALESLHIAMVWF